MICMGVKDGRKYSVFLTYRQSSEGLHCLLQHPGRLLRVEQVCKSVLSPNEVFQPVTPYSMKKSVNDPTYSLIESSLTVKAIACKTYSTALQRNIASCDIGVDDGGNSSWTMSDRSRSKGGFPCSSGANSGAVKEGRNRERVARISSRPESATIYGKALSSTVVPCDHTHSLVLEESFADCQEASTQILKCVQKIN